MSVTQPGSEGRVPRPPRPRCVCTALAPVLHSYGRSGKGKVVLTREGPKARIRLGVQRQAGLGQAERYRKVPVNKGTQTRSTRQNLGQPHGWAKYNPLSSIWQDGVTETGRRGM